MCTETYTVMWMSVIEWKWQKEKKSDYTSESTLTAINSFSSARRGQWTHRCSAQHLKHSQGHTCGSTECSASHAQLIEMYPMQLPWCSDGSHPAGPPACMITNWLLLWFWNQPCCTRAERSWVQALFVHVQKIAHYAYGGTWTHHELAL